MKDIKELALKVKTLTYPDWNVDIDRYLEEFATRLIAAYCAEQEPVAWKDTMTTEYADGTVEHQPMLHGYKGWESLPNGSDLFAAPQQAAYTEGQEPAWYHYCINGNWDGFSKELPPDDAYDEGTLTKLFTAPPEPEGDSHE